MALFVVYNKHFTTGTLAGITIPSYMPVAEDSAELRLKQVSRFTPANPGVGALTNEEYYNTDVKLIDSTKETHPAIGRQWAA